MDTKMRATAERSAGRPSTKGDPEDGTEKEALAEEQRSSPAAPSGEEGTKPGPSANLVLLWLLIPFVGILIYGLLSR